MLAAAAYVSGIEALEDAYVGDFGSGMRHGQGKYTFSNPDAHGAYYEGAFKATHVEAVAAVDGEEAAAPPVQPYHGGLPHGEGIFVYPDGSHYAGSFSEGKRHGHGTYTCVTEANSKALRIFR